MRRVLQVSPGSVRALAREAGVSPRLLQLIRDGERRATVATVGKVVAASERLAGRHLEAARILRETLPLDGEENDHE